MVDELRKYEGLKREYFRIANKKLGIKGTIRTLIGIKTWAIERDLLQSGNGYINSHVTAFSDAIEGVKGLRSKADFISELEKVKKSWSEQENRLLERSRARPIICPPIKNISKCEHNGLKAISLFSGAMGLDIGFMAAGFDLRLTNDLDPKSRDTAGVNVPYIPFINKDIDDVPTKELLTRSSIEKGEVDVLIGGPPCQPFSPAGKRVGLSDPRASPLRYFIKAVKEIKPRAFVMEEVPGLLSSRIKHYPISVREQRKPTSEEERGSAFKVVLEMLRSTGYHFTYARVNAADYGSPQVRERVVFIGLREGTPSLPNPTHSNDPNMRREPWNSLWEATVDLSSSPGDYVGLSEKVKGYMKHVGPGGNWRNLPEDLVKGAMGGAYYSGGGKMGFYRRLSWDEPSPTVVTTPSQKGTMFVHPEADRQLSVQEFARIQGFPENWYFAGNVSDRYRLVGNAVPIHLSNAIASHLKGILEGNETTDKTGICAYV